MATFARKVKSHGRNIISSAIRFLNTDRTSSLQGCFLLGEQGIISFPGAKFQELEDYFQVDTILTPIPKDHTFPCTLARPYMLKERFRSFARSGSLAPYMANQNLVLYTDLFTKGNVGVHRDYGIVVFRNYGIGKKISKPSSEGYHAYCEFLKGLIGERHGKDSLSKLPLGLEMYLADLCSPTVSERMIVDHPMTFSNRVYGEVCTEIYRLLIKEFPLSSANSLADKILKAIGSGNPGVLSNVLQNGLLPQFLPWNLQRLYPTSRFPFTANPIYLSPEEEGKVVVHGTRHGYNHGMEQRSLQTVNMNFPHNPSFTRDDVVQLCRLVFAEHPGQALRAFETEHILDKLHVRDRHPIPFIYLSPLGCCFSHEAQDLKVHEESSV